MPSIAAVEETRSVEVFSLGVVHIRAVRGAVMHSVAFPDAGSINDILDRATVRAREIVETRRDDIRLVADALLDRETLTGDETIAIIERGSIHADA